MTMHVITLLEMQIEYRMIFDDVYYNKIPVLVVLWSSNDHMHARR